MSLERFFLRQDPAFCHSLSFLADVSTGGVSHQLFLLSSAAIAKIPRLSLKSAAGRNGSTWRVVLHLAFPHTSNTQIHKYINTQTQIRKYSNQQAWEHLECSKTSHMIFLHTKWPKLSKRPVEKGSETTPKSI